MISPAPPVPLVRRFIPLSGHLDPDNEVAFAAALSRSNGTGWPDLLGEYRTIVLADAGAGKTFEMWAQANKLRSEGRPAFFLRIEDLVNSVQDALEVGTPETLRAWLASTDDAWFFLDSVDEAKLDSAKAFTRAIRRFAREIHDALHRAHIVLSSRPYAWSPTDTVLVANALPFKAAAADQSSHGAHGDDDGDEVAVEKNASADGPRIYKLAPLDRADVRIFARHRGISEVETLLTAIERADLWSQTERPFDLDDLLATWRPNEPLGSRLEILRRGIRRRLDEIDEHRRDLQPLNLDRALSGARRLAAAVTLTKQVGVRVPDGLRSAIGLEATEVLADWEPAEVKALLARAVFNDALYGAVRFRHREVRDLLTAEWLHEQLNLGRARREIEALIFREQYGEPVISPTMRSVLPWLILFDANIRKRAFEICPEIATEGGDIAQLPVRERGRLLADIVARIVSKRGERSAQYNDAIARVAQADLAQDVRRLIQQHGQNDDAIFFLGRLVWQGELTECLDLLYPIAADPTRGSYARIAAARAVLVVGTPEQTASLWDAILASAVPIDRRLLAELVSSARRDPNLIARVLRAIDLLASPNEREVAGLTTNLLEFVDRLDQEELAIFARGVGSMLDREPHIERKYCAISREFAWLMSVAAHAAERLIAMRAAVSLTPEVLNILMKVSVARKWGVPDVTEYRTTLSQRVSSWLELNDALYWTSVRSARAHHLAETGERLIDDLAITWPDPLWRFSQDSFERLLKCVESEPLRDDQLVALWRAHRVFVEAGKPRALRERLRSAAAGAPELADALQRLFKPVVSDDLKRALRRMRASKRTHKNRQRREAQNRRAFVDRLKAAPDIVRHHPSLKPGQLSSAQFHLLRTVEGDAPMKTRASGADWRSLVPKFGEEVARAYRDAAVAHWRAYRPGLGSEGANTRTVEYSLVFGMAGLEIEANETNGFPATLSEDEARHALRYFVWEMNGFPRWLEPLVKARPQLGIDAIWTELAWELQKTQAGEALHYVLHDVVYHAPWLHSIIAARLFDWLCTHEVRNVDTLRYIFRILVNGRIEPSSLSKLAQAKTASTSEPLVAHWYSLWVDTEPDSGITAVTRWLEAMPDFAEASHQAQLFITTLLGGRHGDQAPSVGAYQTAGHLKALYVLMHRFVRTDDDLRHTGVYSPGLRDDAQDARNALFTRLAQIPGKPAYVMMAELAREHPVPAHRLWMARNATERAIADSDLQPWTARQVYEFARDTELTPSTHRQLFDLALSRLYDFKDRIERGNASPARTYQRVEAETEMRNLVANWLNEHTRDRYSVAQEPEYANAQRADIWVQHPNVASPVPIELKLADKWTGPVLCERLCNQLVGGYLRETQAGCGIMLLMWRGSVSEQRWEVGGRRVAFDELPRALEAYWQSVAGGYHEIDVIRVIGIDLTARERASSST